jgi:hypothetical protein
LLFLRPEEKTSGRLLFECYAIIFAIPSSFTFINMHKSNEFKIRFDGQVHQLDAQVLISSLIHTTAVIHQINNHLNTGKKIDVKVFAPERGSFLIHLQIDATTLESLKNLFTHDNIDSAAAIITTFVSLITLKKVLKGKEPRDVKQGDSNTTIVSGDGNTVTIHNTVYEIYKNNSVVNDSLSQTFDVLDNDHSVVEFALLDVDDKPLVRVDRAEFKDMSVKSECLDGNRKITTEITRLNILRVSFEDKLKWDFYYKGNKISAKIADPDFQKRIDQGEAFAKGDVLEVEFTITQVFEPSVNTFVNKSYQINRIIQHYSRNEQLSIEFSEPE